MYTEYWYIIICRGVISLCTLAIFIIDISIYVKNKSLVYFYTPFSIMGWICSFWFSITSTHKLLSYTIQEQFYVLKNFDLISTCIRLLANIIGPIQITIYNSIYDVTLFTVLRMAIYLQQYHNIECNVYLL
jgi:hypothetical protein